MLLPMSGLSEVGGIVADTMFRKNVNESRTVTSVENKTRITFKPTNLFLLYFSTLFGETKAAKVVSLIRLSSAESVGLTSRVHLAVLFSALKEIGQKDV